MGNLRVGKADEGSRLDRQVLQGATAEAQFSVHHDLDALIGTWNEEDEVAFTAAVSPFEVIDPALWD